MMMDAWQPIETAPKDGTQVLVWSGQEFAVVEYYQDKDGTSFWEIGHTPGARCFAAIALTHWMPLPEPPGEMKKPQEGSNPGAQKAPTRAKDAP